MKKIAALALAALFTVGTFAAAHAGTDPKKPETTVTSTKKKKNSGKDAAHCAPATAGKMQGCASAPTGGSCCSKPAAATTGGSGK
ncbi:MAG: hypothetical protein FJX93_00090 [Bacteroidetes bacterium]|nr:hypothetical protein [Bacteroidota bacterium]